MHFKRFIVYISITKGRKKNNQNFAHNADIILPKHFSWKCHKQDYQLRKINKEQFDRCWPKDCSQDWDHNMQTAQIPTLRPTATGSSSGDLYISGQQSPSTTRIRCKIWEHIWKGSAVTEGCTDSKHFFSFLLSHWWVWRSCLSSTLGRGCAPHCPH